MAESRSSINIWVALADLFAGLMLFFVTAFLINAEAKPPENPKFSAELVRAMNVATQTTKALQTALEKKLDHDIGVQYSETDISIPSAALFRSFGYDDFLADEEKKRLLTAVGEALITALRSAGTEQKYLRVVVEGHTDADPIRSRATAPTQPQPMPTNWELSSRRATGLLRFFEGLGLDPKVYKVMAIGLADTNPVASNDNEAGKKLNRRIVIRLEPDIQSILEGVRIR